MGRQITKLTSNIGLFCMVLLGYQTICEAADGGADMILPNVIYINDTTTANSERTTTAILVEQTTSANHPQTQPARSETPTTTLPTHSNENNQHEATSVPSTNIPTSDHPTTPDNDHETTKSRTFPLRFSKKPLTDKTSTEHADEVHTSPVSESVSTNSTYYPYSWWKIVVTLVVFCAMAGVILWILKLVDSKMCKRCRGKHSEEDIEIVDINDTLSEKISRV